MNVSRLILLLAVGASALIVAGDAQRTELLWPDGAPDGLAVVP